MDPCASVSELLSSSREPALLDTRGWAKFKAGDYQAAVNLLQQAVNAAPESATLRYHLGMAQWKAGNVAAARDNLQAAVKDDRPFFGIDEAKQALATLNASG